MATDQWDDAILAKLQRAMDLRDALQERQIELRGPSGGEDVREYRSTTNESDRDDPIVRMEWHLVSGPDPVPLSFAALMGDVIQNLRATLDYSVWAAASNVVRRDHPTQIVFPLKKKETDFRKWVKDKSGWFSNDTLEVMESSQPYKAPRDQLHPLRVLQVLSNTDKHKLLNVVDNAHIDQGIKLVPEPPVYDFEAVTGPVRPGDLIARFECPRPPFKLVIDVIPSFGWYESVAFEEPGRPLRWLRLDKMMNALCPAVVNTVGYMAAARHRQTLGVPEPDTGPP